MSRNIDLDAGRRELEEPDGIPVTFKGQEFTLPAEFPVDVLDPFLSDEFDLPGLIRAGIAKSRDAQGKVRPIPEIVVDALFDRPTLPIDLIKAIYAAFELLFGAEEYARFKAARPSIQDYTRLTAGLFGLYGVSLGEAFASPSSSESDGATPKEIADGSTSSTSEPSGDGQDNAPGSSE